MNYKLRHISEEHHFYVNADKIINQPYKVAFFSQGENMPMGVSIWKSEFNTTLNTFYWVKLHQSSSIDRSPGKELAQHYLQLQLDNKLP